MYVYTGKTIGLVLSTVLSIHWETQKGELYTYIQLLFFLKTIFLLKELLISTMNILTILQIQLNKYEFAGER
jgi:hypothetical protein